MQFNRYNCGVISLFFLISWFGLIDSIFRKNEIFTIGALIPAATYILDVIAGCVKYNTRNCFVFRFQHEYHEDNLKLKILVFVEKFIHSN